MKVLTVIATIFMPLTVLTGVYGMNVNLPQLPSRARRPVLLDPGSARARVGRHAVVLPNTQVAVK
jgi:hypothetical protein